MPGKLNMRLTDFICINKDDAVYKQFSTNLFWSARVAHQKNA